MKSGSIAALASIAALGLVALGFAAAMQDEFVMRSSSMLPVLRNGERITCAPANGAPLALGDIIVYRHPKKGSNWLHMIAGVAGDTVEMREGVLWINGVKVPRKRLGDFEIEAGRKVPQFEETLPNGVKTLVLDTDPIGWSDFTRPFHVPPAHVFVLGNNRDNSIDSRARQEIGYVPTDNVICRIAVRQ